MRRLIAVVAAGFLGWLVLLPSPAEAQQVSISGQVRLNAIYSDRLWGSGQSIAPKLKPSSAAQGRTRMRAFGWGRLGQRSPQSIHLRSTGNIGLRGA